LFYKNFQFFYDKYLSDKNYIDFNLVLTGEAMRIIVEDRRCKELEVFKDIYNRGIEIGFSYLMSIESKLNGPLHYTETEFIDFVDCIITKYPKLTKSFFSAYKALQDKYSYKYYAIQNGSCYNDDEIFTGSPQHVNSKCLACNNFMICDSTQNVATYQSKFTFCPLNVALEKIKETKSDMFDAFQL
jgi:hypothetical protein